MDPSNKEHAQPTNVDSAATPPTRHRKPSSDAEAATGQSSDAASARSEEMAAAAADSSTAPAVDCPTMSAARPRSAVFAARRLSPAERCDQDSLSVTFSFLVAADFAAASRVCRHWSRAAELLSAWPEFSVERLISCLIEDENHRPQSRSVRVRVDADYLPTGALEWLAQSPKWRGLAELDLNGEDEQDEDEDEYEYNPLVRLEQVVQLPQLQSLRLKRVHLNDVAATFSSLAPRLQAFKCENLDCFAAVQSHLHLLANLRVLMLNGTLDAQALLPLHQLELLQLVCSDIQYDLLLVIRRLSVRHRLRHLSVHTMYGNVPPNLDLLVAELSGADIGLAPAALVSIRLCCNLSESRSALLSLPSLTRLHVRADATNGQITAHPQPPLPPSPLQRLHLDFKYDESGAVRLLQLAAVRAPQLRELHMSHIPPSFDQLVWSLHSLRLLDIQPSESSPLPQELLQSLASLPLFNELIVRQHAWQSTTFELTAETIRSIAESPSWCLTRLVGGSTHSLQITQPDDVDARLAERLADFCVRSEWDGQATSHRLVIGADGSVAWQQTAI